LIAHDTIGYGPLSIILEDSKNIEEILINSPSSEIMIFHQKYRYCKTNLKFNGEREFRFIINKLLESLDRELSSEFPIIDADIFNGARIHAQLKPYAANGSIAAIRLNQHKNFDIRKLIQTNTTNIDVIAYLWLAIEANSNIVISGAPASGKTSLLTALNSLMPRYQRIISIEEDINELKFNANFINSISLQGSTNKNQINLRDQVINSLRLRPDRLIIGEIRGAETNEIFSGTNFGIPFMTTMHSSENGKVLINRLSSKPMNVQPQLMSMLDLSVFMKQDINSRKLDSISEYKWLMRGEINTKEIDKNTETDNDLVFKILDVVVDNKLDYKKLKQSKVVAKYSQVNMLSVNEAIEELKKRVLFLSQINQEQNLSKSIEDFILEYNKISD
ncbi:MAG: type II/IV secretion system ATPase subunit, partial [Candidatus Micrarchaeaceae archaeon]